MKVRSPGTLVISGDNSFAHVTGWSFDCEGEALPLDQDEVARRCLACVLNYVAKVHGVALVRPAEPAERIPLDIERAAADIIAVARWNQL